jgi:hypothetical protein
MFTMTLSLNVTAIYLVAADIIVLLSYILVILYRKRQYEQEIDTISRIITAYFGISGIEVVASCHGITGSDRFIAMVESEPVKRFRCSHIVELSLIQHILKVSGRKVEKIYWRFPLPRKEGEVLSAIEEARKDDEYLAEGLTQAKSETEYNVEGASWDQYETALGKTKIQP